MEGGLDYPHHRHSAISRLAERRGRRSKQWRLCHGGDGAGHEVDGAVSRQDLIGEVFDRAGPRVGPGRLDRRVRRACRPRHRHYRPGHLFGRF
jgi:hypothetical protein